MKHNVHVDMLDYSFALHGAPKRVVSLVSSATEAMNEMGLLDRVVGVSEYCERYVPGLEAPVVGQYLNCDWDQLETLKPDLILITSGVQLRLGRKLAKAGWPVYVLPLAQSFYGILENIMILGGVLGALPEARRLSDEMMNRAGILKKQGPERRPKVYLELWLGRHMRAVGGLSFIRDLVAMAGGDLIFGDRAVSYFQPDFDEVAAMKPDLYLFFHEPEYLIDPDRLIAERAWCPSTAVVVSTVECGKNMIQDGPSFLDTVEWLQNKLLRSV